MDNGKFPEVLVDRDDDLRSLKGTIQDFLVAGIVRPTGDCLHLVTRRRENSRSSSPDARVDEHLQCDYRSVNAGSTRS